MVYIISQTRDEKIIMYMKLTKRELVEMLVNTHEILDRRGWPGAELVKVDEVSFSPTSPNTCLTS